MVDLDEARPLSDDDDNSDDWVKDGLIEELERVLCGDDGLPMGKP